MMEWQQHENETPTAFNAFHKYYLVQSHPRSVNEAYRRWYADRYKLQPSDKQVTKKVATGLWQNWSKGLMYDGRPIEGLKSWPERAAAFDDHLAALRIKELEARHMPEAEVIALISDIARGDLGDFAEVQGLDSLKDHPKSYLINNLIERVSHNEKSGSTSRNFQIKLESKLDALEKLARHYGLYNDKLDITSGGEKVNLVILPKQDEQS